MNFISPSQMPVALYSKNQHTISTGEFKALSFEKRGEYLERHDSKQDILEVAKKMVDTFNSGDSAKDFEKIILAMHEDKACEFLRYFVYAAVPLAEKLKTDMRNEASANFFKKLVNCPFDSMDFSKPFHAPAAVDPSEPESKSMAHLKAALNNFMDTIDEYKKDFSLTESEIAGVLAAAIMCEHPTIQQSFVRGVFQAVITLAGACTVHDELITNQGLLVIINAFCQLSDDTYFPYV